MTIKHFLCVVAVLLSTIHLAACGTVEDTQGVPDAPPRPVNVEILVVGDGVGAVVSADNAVSCESPRCVISLPEGAEVELVGRALQEDGFDGWSGSCSGQDRCRLTASEGASVTATFRRAWSVQYSYRAGSLDDAKKVAIAPDGTIVVVGEATDDSSSSASQCLTLHFDRNGGRLSAVAASRGSRCFLWQVAFNDDDTFVTAGGWGEVGSTLDLQWILFSYDFKGSGGWTRTHNVGRRADVVTALDALPDGTVVAFGTGQDDASATSSEARFYDAAGEFLRAVPLGVGMVDEALRGSDGTYSLIGRLDPNSSETSGFYVSMSSDGTVGERRADSTVALVNVRGEVFKVAPSSGSSVVIRDLTGALRTTLELEPGTSLVDICAFRDGSFAVASAVFGGVTYMARYESDGTKRWSRSAPPMTTASTVACDQDYNSVFGGYVNVEMADRRDVWLRKYFD